MYEQALFDTTEHEPGPGGPTYVDLYLLPVPESNIDAYKRQAQAFGSVAREHGALSYREFRGDDLEDGLDVAAGDLMTAALVEFHSREHRDEVMAAVMLDPRVKGIVQEPLADFTRMSYGGFEPLVTV